MEEQTSRLQDPTGQANVRAESAHSREAARAGRCACAFTVTTLQRLAQSETSTQCCSLSCGPAIAPDLTTKDMDGSSAFVAHFDEIVFDDSVCAV